MAFRRQSASFRAKRDNLLREHLDLPRTQLAELMKTCGLYSAKTNLPDIRSSISTRRRQLGLPDPE